MSDDDAVIAKALTAGLRRLLVAALIHSRESGAAAMPSSQLHEAFKREIDRLVMRGTTGSGEDIELTTAVRRGLHLFVEAAQREAVQRGTAHDRIQ